MSTADTTIADADTAIAATRADIDALDAELIDLLDRRRALSDSVQQTRVAAGGVRIELGREREILDTYHAALGRPGVELATAVLRVCRGTR